MKENNFIENYLEPSSDRFDRIFTHPLPQIEGLKKCGDFIIQCELDDTFSTNIVTKYENEISRVRLIEVYKCTQDKITGIFVRLMGTFSLVKDGYPRLSLDAGISNVSPFTTEKEDITTRVSLGLPQATFEQMEILFLSLSELAKKDGISHREREANSVPEFWGKRWTAEIKGVNFDVISKLREHAWSAYRNVIEQTKANIPFDYRPMQEFMIFDISKREHLMFKRMGLSVPVEVQAAFFSVMVSAW
jgi:hypothetical protein